MYYTLDEEWWDRLEVTELFGYSYDSKRKFRGVPVTKDKDGAIPPKVWLEHIFFVDDYGDAKHCGCQCVALPYVPETEAERHARVDTEYQERCRAFKREARKNKAADIFLTFCFVTAAASVMTGVIYGIHCLILIAAIF